jgi:hypothetical protein
MSKYNRKVIEKDDIEFDIYRQEQVDQYEEDDSISSAEAGFMAGYMSW